VVETHPEEFGHLDEALRKAAMLKFRDIVYETVQEYNRCGEFVRIFPCKGSKAYEKFFSGLFGTRMLNRLIHKVLFTSEIVQYERLPKFLGAEGQARQKLGEQKNLKYDIDVPQELSYDHYKNKAAQVQNRKKSTVKDSDNTVEAQTKALQEAQK
jgi:hypothetical protein